MAWRLPRSERPAQGRKGPAQTSSEEAAQQEGHQSKRLARAKESTARGSEEDHSTAMESSKRKRGKKQESKEQEGLDWTTAFQTLAKLTLSTANTARVLTGCVLTTYLLDSSLAFIAAAEDEGKAYDQAVKAEGPGHKRGAPHPYVFSAVLDKWLEDQEFSGKHPQQAQILGQLKASGEEDVQRLAFTILYFRIKLIYRGEKGAKLHKVTWAVAPLSSLYGQDKTPFSASQLQDGIVVALEYYGGTKKPGQPPKAEVERATERLLSRLAK